MDIKIRKTKVLVQSRRAHESGARIIANRGGTRSGKTYSLLVYLLQYAMLHTTEIDIVSESFPHLKRGVLQDVTDILDSWQFMEGEEFTHNRSDHTYTMAQSGSTIRFFSVDDWGKVKGSRRDILFINEANRIEWETFRQLAVRTTGTIFLDWNPDAEFWYEKRGIASRSDTVEIHSTYLDNPFLDEVQIAEIEANKADANWWRVYGLGLVGRTEGVVFKRWQIVGEIPDDARLIARGLDFGFINDPTAIVDVYQQDGKLWLQEVCYQRGLTNDRIADILRGKEGWTIADSAEQKSIAEIRNYGIRQIEPAVKGKDSVRAGIDILQRYDIMITEDSTNVIEEFKQYKWKQDRITGQTLNEPEDKNNHAIDAVRYVALKYLAQAPTRKRPRAKTTSF